VVLDSKETKISYQHQYLLDEWIRYHQVETTADRLMQPSVLWWFSFSLSQLNKTTGSWVQCLISRSVLTCLRTYLLLTIYRTDFAETGGLA